MTGVAMQVAAANASLFGGSTLFDNWQPSILAHTTLRPLYLAPKHIRGTITAGYHTAKTFGVLLAAIVNNSKRFAFVPDSPRYFMKYGKRDKARQGLARIRHRDEDDALRTSELDEIEASLEFEHSIGDVSVRDCFKRENKQLYRFILGMNVMAFSQLLGVNIIKYFGRDFFQQAGITNSFVISMATNIVSFSMTIPALYLIERLGRRSLLIIGYIGSCITKYIIAIVGLVAAGSDLARRILVSFSSLYIAVESAGVGPPSLVIVGEVFPLRARAKSMALSLECLSLEQIDELYNTVPYAWQSAIFIPRSLSLELNKAHKPGDVNVSDTEVSDADDATVLSEEGIQEIQQPWSNL
ncbi:hypothetical protein V1505DRAFT_408936 [Lipomyces doorenjongii]